MGIFIREKCKVLIFAQYFLPGFKAGGPIRSIQNLVETTMDWCDFQLFTGDRDLLDSASYQNVVLNQWISQKNYKVYYCSRNLSGFMDLVSSVRNSSQIYINSFFSPFFAILPIFLGSCFKKKIIIAPRGEFSPGALMIKSMKKRVFLYFFKFFKMNKKVIWHATNSFEKNDILRVMGDQVKVVIAPNLSGKGLNTDLLKKMNCQKPSIKEKLLLLFLGRVAEKKNVEYALKVLKDIHLPTEFSIYGPLEDPRYYDKCKALVQTLPPNVSVKFHGAVSYHQTHELFQKHHFLFFPTKGENYSHVIAEALQNGCPVILSDQHPWENLEKWQAGWSIPLDSPKKFLEILNSLSRLNQEDYERHSESALSYWKRKYTEDINMSESLYLKLFNEYDQE